jgi:hypothetical protein
MADIPDIPEIYVDGFLVPDPEEIEWEFEQDRCRAVADMLRDAGLCQESDCGRELQGEPVWTLPDGEEAWYCAPHQGAPTHLGPDPMQQYWAAIDAGEAVPDAQRHARNSFDNARRAGSADGSSADGSHDDDPLTRARDAVATASVEPLAADEATASSHHCTDNVAEDTHMAVDGY